MSNYLVTGARNTPHITSMDDASLNAGIFGNGAYILGNGEKLRAEMTTANNCRIYDGDVVTQGRHSRIERSEYVDLTINNGAAGMRRNDLVVLRYTKNADTGVESTDFIVIQGTPAASNPADPAYNEGDIFDGDLIVDFPLYRIKLDGLVASEPVRLAEKAGKLSGLEGAEIKIIRLAPNASLTFSAVAATAIAWTTAAISLIVGFRNGVNSRIFEGSSAANIATSVSDNAYTITNNTSVYLRGFVVIDSGE